MRARIFKFVLITLLIVFLFSCGNSNVTAPPESFVIINPSALTVADGTIGSGVVTWHTHDFTITVTDQQKRPIRDADILISYQWAVNDSLATVVLCSGTGATGIGADRDGDGVGDCIPVDGPLAAHTDEFGNYLLRFDFEMGVGVYKAFIEVRAGENFNAASVQVSTS